MFAAYTAIPFQCIKCTLLLFYAHLRFSSVNKFQPNSGSTHSLYISLHFTKHSPLCACVYGNIMCFFSNARKKVTWKQKKIKCFPQLRKTTACTSALVTFESFKQASWKDLRFIVYSVWSLFLVSASSEKFCIHLLPTFPFFLQPTSCLPACDRVQNVFYIVCKQYTCKSNPCYIKCTFTICLGLEEKLGNILIAYIPHDDEYNCIVDAFLHAFIFPTFCAQLKSTRYGAILDCITSSRSFVLIIMHHNPFIFLLTVSSFSPV